MAENFLSHFAQDESFGHFGYVTFIGHYGHGCQQ